jgi:hypothetical protein
MRKGGSGRHPPCRRQCVHRQLSIPERMRDQAMQVKMWISRCGFPDQQSIGKGHRHARRKGAGLKKRAYSRVERCENLRIAAHTTNVQQFRLAVPCSASRTDSIFHQSRRRECGILIVPHTDLFRVACATAGTTAHLGVATADAITNRELRHGPQEVRTLFLSLVELR